MCVCAVYQSLNTIGILWVYHTFFFFWKETDVKIKMLIQNGYIRVFFFVFMKFCYKIKTNNRMLRICKMNIGRCIVFDSKNSLNSTSF